MYTIFLIGIAVCLVIGTVFILSVLGVITYWPTVLLCVPVFRALDKSYNSFITLIIKAVMFVVIVAIVVIVTTGLNPLVPIGILLGFVYGFYKANKLK